MIDNDAQRVGERIDFVLRCIIYSSSNAGPFIVARIAQVFGFETHITFLMPTLLGFMEFALLLFCLLSFSVSGL